MKDTKDNKSTTAEAKPNIFDLTELSIPLTYEDLAPGMEPLKIIFHFQLEFVDEEIEARQSFFGLTEAERKEKMHEHRVNRLALLASRAPEGLPGFPETDGDHAKAIREFFGGTNPLKRKITQDAIVAYEGASQPREFFRRF